MYVCMYVGMYVCVCDGCMFVLMVLVVCLLTVQELYGEVLISNFLIYPLLFNWKNQFYITHDLSDTSHTISLIHHTRTLLIHIYIQ